MFSGAVVRLQCDSSRTPTTVYATTDKNGYFFAQAPTNVTSFGANRCRAYLVSSPLATCQKPTDLNWGLTGAPLRFERWLGGPLWFAIYTVGPFAFEPANATECPPR
ncbi:hypothetical protein QJS04_geneDACA025025 [Acorus gramineus]|uniref:Uncharacterized protein n=1 Tax=Acorus gramineus TaxID=55184 RepID=A0AAV8ZZQ5_ACOGR|nr:hypothetical protein QJS04_geneDACA025025 [Acorus gramineus]